MSYHQQLQDIIEDQVGLYTFNLFLYELLLAYVLYLTFGVLLAKIHLNFLFIFS